MTDRGRPAYEPTDKDRRIARVIGVDPKTLRKHFGDELNIGSAKLEAQLAQNLLRIAQGPDRQALIATIFALKARFGWVEAGAPPRDRPLGKNEAAQLAAEHAGEGTSWDDLLRTPETAATFRKPHEH